MDSPRPERFWDLLDTGQRELLTRAGVRHAHPVGTVLLREGSAARSVFVLLTGRVKVVATGASGSQGVLAIRMAGDVLGELAAVDERRRSATVVAVDPIEVLRIPAGAFTDILRTSAGVTYALLRVLSTRLRSADLRRVEHGETTGRRVAATLADLTIDHGTPAAGAITITLPFSQDELAMMVGASREAVVRALRALRAEGIVSTGRQQVVILRPDLLARRATGER